MTGYRTILMLKRFEQEVDELGLRIGHVKYNYSQDTDKISLMPKDDEALPIFSRDAEIFVGTVEQAQEWMRGVKWARNYDRMLKVSDDNKRAKREQHERNRLLIEKLKTAGPEAEQ